MPLYSVLIVIHNIQLLRNFCEEKKVLLQTQEKTFAGSDVATLEAFATENPYMDF